MSLSFLLHSFKSMSTPDSVTLITSPLSKGSMSRCPCTEHDGFDQRREQDLSGLMFFMQERLLKCTL
jgi:hypothetical protein